MEKLNIAIYPHLAKRKELLRACHLISGKTLEQNGCMDSRVLPGSSKDSAIHLEQQWHKRNLLDDYFRSDHFSALLGAIKLLADKYELTINDGSPAEGINSVNRARNSNLTKAQR